MKKADRLRELEESETVILEKCEQLAELLKNSKCTIVYTGAGISTSAKIPDYRGPNGVWTLAEKGIEVKKCADPVECSPTTSHMVLKEMCRRGMVRHILSQNCDGLHLRSGVPQKMLSEIHGNMHIEVCNQCDPPRQYIRSFDVTKKSGFRKHCTGRTCTACNSALQDTIVHFGERGRLPWPLNWNGVVNLVDQSDLILCLGTSMAVLKEYQFLWPKPKSDTKIAIVNLQWTPKDRASCLKINAKCDTVLENLAKSLSLPMIEYCRNCDPVLNPRRSTRVSELMERLTDCLCHLRSPRRKAEVQDGPKGAPGWWAAGMQKTIQRARQANTKKNRRSAGRPRKRKSSTTSSTDDSVKEKLSRLDSSSSASETSSLDLSNSVDDLAGVADASSVEEILDNIDGEGDLATDYLHEDIEDEIRTDDNHNIAQEAGPASCSSSNAEVCLEKEKEGLFDTSMKEQDSFDIFDEDAHPFHPPEEEKDSVDVIKEENDVLLKVEESELSVAIETENDSLDVITEEDIRLVVEEVVVYLVKQTSQDQ